MPTLTAVEAGDAPRVTLGSYSYEVVPQRIGRLRKRMGRALGDLESLQGDSLTAFVGASLERAHNLLKVFIPDLMPVWEFCGYRSEQAMVEEDDDDDGEWGPTLPDVVTAFEVVMRVNRLDLLGHLRTVVSPEIMRAYVSTRIAEALKEASPTTSSANTASTPGPPSPSTDTGTTPRTLESNVV